MVLKAQDLESFETFKRACHAAASQIKENTPFCMFTEVHLPDSHAKDHVFKPFLTVGSPLNVITPLLKELKGAKKLLCTGFCSLDQGKIFLTVHKGRLNPDLVRSRGVIFKDLFGKEIHVAPANH